jgi:hypothetical protein
MPHLQFPTTYVYWEKLKDHEQLKNKYMPIIDKIEQDHTDKLENPYSCCTLKYISIKSNIEFLDQSDINKIIWKPIDNFIDEINSNYQFKINIKESYINSYWFNTYHENDNQEVHNHYGHPIRRNGFLFYPTFSGVYILNDDNDSSSLIFKTLREQPFMPIEDEFMFDTGKHSAIKEGTVIIFPYQLLHMVRNCIKPGRRTIAFNIFSNLKV